MKHKLILIGCLLLVAGALTLAVHSNTQVLQTAKVHAATVAKQVRQDLATRNQLESQVKEDDSQKAYLQTQCEAGLKDYKLLTAFQRTQATAPVCSVQNASTMTQ